MSNRRRPLNTYRRRDELGVDANGCPTRTTEIEGAPVVIHYADIPESDITTHDGLRLTTPLRTTIDMAADLETWQLRELVDHFMGRELFTVEEAMVRIDQPDLTSHRGAQLLRALLSELPTT